MNEATLFLAKLVGPIMVLVALAFLMRKDDMKKLMHDVVSNTYTLFLQGMVESTAGLAIVLHHNLWDSPTAIIISLLGWLMFIEGAFELLTSNASMKRAMAGFSKEWMTPSGVVVLAAGAYLVWQAYLV